MATKSFEPNADAWAILYKCRLGGDFTEAGVLAAMTSHFTLMGYSGEIPAEHVSLVVAWVQANENT